MLPHQGAGAGHAIEVCSRIRSAVPCANFFNRQDAFVLAQVLGNSTSSTLESALLAYEHVRLPVANHVLQGSALSGAMYEFDSPLGQDFAQLGPAIEAMWDWAWETQPEDEVQRALAASLRSTNVSI